VATIERQWDRPHQMQRIAAERRAQANDRDFLKRMNPIFIKKNERCDSSRWVPSFFG
jgi:hypothetical protein